MNGFEFIKNIRRIKSEIKVVLMSAFEVYDDSEFTTDFKSNNIDSYIQKPFSLEQLNGIVKTHI